MNVHVKLLAYQLTGHVVWMGIDPKRVPNFAGLDYLSYIGTADVKQLWQDLIGYRLTTSYTAHPVSFFNSDLSADHVNDVKLLRAKCFAVQFLHNSINWCLEKNGLHENPIANVGVSTLTSVYQNSLNLDHDSASKLAKFKQQEYQYQLDELRSAQIAAELVIDVATSVDQVVDIFKRTQTNLGMLRASTDQLTRLL